MQFNRDASGTMTPLPRPSIDTGMVWSARLGAAGKLSDWDTDLFAPLIARVSGLAASATRREDDDVSMRVIADHGRTATFLIADGVLPPKKMADTVLRVMRRALRHAGCSASPTVPSQDRALVVESMARPTRDRPRAARIEGAVRGEGNASPRRSEAAAAIDEYLAVTATPRPRGGRRLPVHALRHVRLSRAIWRDVLQGSRLGRHRPDERAWDSEMEAQRTRARAGASFARATRARARRSTSA